MKLFQKLLVAGSALSLIAPIGLQASEINLDEMNSYAPKKSSSKKQFNSRSFANEEFVTSKESWEKIDSGTNEFEAGSFSSTTTMDGSASFVMGAKNNDKEYDATSSGALMAHYAYDINLNTSFNGDDNLYVGFVAGNTSSMYEVIVDNSNIVLNDDVLSVDSIFYSFPYGKWDFAVGPKLDQNDLVATTTSKYSDKFYLGAIYPNNVWTLPGLSGAGFSAARQFDNGFNVGANILAIEGSTSDGIFTKEGADLKTIMIGYDAENYGGGVIHTKYDDIWAVGNQTAQYYLTYYGVSKLTLNSTSIGAYWMPSEKLTTNFSVDIVDADIGQSADTFTDFTVSMDYEFNDNNTLSAAMKSLSFLNTNGTADSLGDMFEIYLTHNVNDSMIIRGGIETQFPDNNVGNGTTIKNGGTGDDWVLFDQTVYALETTFKF